ncbi:Acetylesterase [Lachnellula suecica]|uniref:Acetylesterase n=1 Tax=Lachnellula suecica TaxID=602035 RepID=A0A8T9C175_9HELO|nr:Acetylesterase [Lachnellula suecica]
MSSTLSSILASALLVSGFAEAASLNSGRSSGPYFARDNDSTCAATSNWPGWSKVKYAFIFGDSYTQTGFETTGTQPTPTNPLGNPTYPGYTSSNGPNWVDYLTVEYNASKILTYNLAYGGATMNSTLVAPYEPTVSSIADQVVNEWLPTYASKPSTAPWSSDNTLFAIFDGINDIGNSYYNGVAATTTLNAQIFANFHDLVNKLYNAGARNFAFLNVPPVDRSPGTLVYNADAQAMEKADIAAWSTSLTNMTKTLKKEKPDANFFYVDANALFTEVLDKPSSFPQTALYKNTTGYCVDYENCGIPVNEYFWLNTLHPTYPMHEVLAEGVAKVLKTGPNIC